jgi:hypothetical protein
MAIRLASAVGQQRTPVDMYGGIDDAINKAGDAIQADQVRKAEAAAKKKDQEQKYKDAVLATTTFEPLTDVHPKDREKDLAEKKAAFADLVVSSTDPNITKAQFDEKKRKFKEMADNNKYVMERDWKSISSVADKSDSGKGTHDTSRYDDFLMGKTNPTQVSDMPNDDFMAASEGNRAGTLPSENLPSGQGALQNLPNDPNVQGELVLLPNDPNFQGKLEELSKNPNLRGIEQSDGSVRVINKGGQNVSAGNKMNEMKRTETSTLYQGKNYLDLPIEERLKIDINAKENELTTLKKPNIVKAVQGYEGQDFKFGSLTKATTRISPTTGEIIYDFDEEKADKIGRRFASSMVGEGNFGSKEHSQYQRALEYEALKAGNDAGLSGDKLKDFVKEYVPRVAYDDFMRNARAAEAERSKNEKDITKQPSKGLEINFTSGGGGSSNIWNISEGIEAPLYESKDGKKTDKVIGDYYYHAIQTKAAGENPKKFNIAGYTDVQVEGINVNKKTGKPEYIDITIPARYDKYDELIPNTGIKKIVRITEQTEIDNLRTNLGSKLYDGTIGSHKPTKEDAKAAPKKEAAKEVKKQEDLRKKYNY